MDIQSSMGFGLRKLVFKDEATLLGSFGQGINFRNLNVSFGRGSGHFRGLLLRKPAINWMQAVEKLSLKSTLSLELRKAYFLYQHRPQR
jgi:hypothetical protein